MMFMNGTGRPARLRATDIAEERHARPACAAAWAVRQRDAEDRVRAEACPCSVCRRLRDSSVSADVQLVFRRHAAARLADLRPYHRRRPPCSTPLPTVALLVAVAQLRPPRARRRWRRPARSRWPCATGLQFDYDLDRRVAAAVEDLASANVDDGLSW
jgi:hypothetical protein